MKLGRKTLLYSIALGAGILALVMGYMVWMMPSLYVDYKLNSYRSAVRDIHERFVEEKSYAFEKERGEKGHAYVPAVSFAIPLEGYDIRVYNRMFEATVTLQNGELQELLDMLRRQGRSMIEGDADRSAAASWESVAEEMDARIQSLIRALQEEDAKSWIDIKIVNNPYGISTTPWEDQGRSSVQSLGTKGFLMENRVSDGNMQYISYVALTVGEEVYITMMSSIAPSFMDVQPIIIESLPMIVLVLIVIVWTVSSLFSRLIVKPVVRMASYTDSIRSDPTYRHEPMPVKGKDELAKLGHALNRFYAQQQEDYDRLEKESRRKEVFLRASSHQLKTPVAAALLLVESMIDGVGRYKDKETYLPKVKSQLVDMKRIIADILELGKEETPMPEAVELEPFIQRLAEAHIPQATERGIGLELEGSGSLTADPRLLEKIVDSLLANGVNHTAVGGRIRVLMEPGSICVCNQPAHIEEELLPGIKEPFVTGNTDRKGHGLGLYVADYYAGVLGLEFVIENEEEGVKAIIRERKEEKL